jgi:cell division protein FtsB
MRLSDENTREGRHLTPEERIALQAEEIKQLRQENEQLRAQVARVREALRKASARDSWFECDRCANMRDALAAIDKVIGGKEDA